MPQLYYQFRVPFGYDLLLKVKRLARSHKLPLAIALSLSLHAFLLSLMFHDNPSGLASHGYVGDTVGGVESIDISFVRSQESALALQPKPEIDEDIEALSKLAPSSIIEPSDLAMDKVPVVQQVVETPPSTSGASANILQGATATGEGVQNNQVSALWRAIAPCWNRIADKDAMPVSLEISFSPLGNIAKPPVLLGAPDGDLGDRLERSRAKAVEALSQCGPYLMAYGQSNVMVAFPGRGS